MQKRLNKKGALALSQIIILLVGIIAVSCAVGSSIGVVSGQDIILDNTFGTQVPEGYTPIEGIEGGYENGAGMMFDAETEKYASRINGKWVDTDATGKVLQSVTTPGGNPPSALNPTGDGSSFLSETLGIESAGMETNAAGEITGYKTPTFWQTGGYGDAILSGAQWAGVAYMAVTMLSPMLGLDEEQKDALSKSAALGAGIGKSFHTLIQTGGVGEKWIGFTEGGFWTPTSFSLVGGALIAIAVYYWLYEDKSIQLVTFTCEPWEAPVGGKYCEECNNQGILPCSEYQCNSLGQACQLLNKGTDEEACTWVNRHDIEYPIIEPWEDALLDDYDYTPDNTISPPDRGVIIEHAGLPEICIPAFEAFTFGITTDEPAKCKIDYIRKETFDEMNFYFGGSSIFKYNHTQTMSLPGSDSSNITVETGNDFTVYVRCADANGNYNPANFVFKYCVDEGPDTTPPAIKDTSISNNMPIAYNTTEIDLKVYVNEPATCKWSHTDQDYDSMNEQMSCSSSIIEINAQLLYTCATTLTGLKNKVDNDFYFRCKDQPSKPDEDRNVNVESYKFTLIGTQPLVIDEVGPNETVKDSTTSIKVTLTAETSAGYSDGDATCYYSESCYTEDGAQNEYMAFFYETGTSSYTHSQEVWVSEGNYLCSIKCVDLGGNMDYANTSYTVETDLYAPMIVRAYHEESYLKLITDEAAECVYDTLDCSYSYEDGVRFTNIDELEHYTDWSTSADLFVKCKDEHGNQPLPNVCSIIARPFEMDFVE